MYPSQNHIAHLLEFSFLQIRMHRQGTYHNSDVFNNREYTRLFLFYLPAPVKEQRNPVVLADSRLDRLHILLALQQCFP